MSNDTGIMIELQNLWNIVMKLEGDVERSRKSIKLWESRNMELKADVAKTEANYKNLNLKIKQDELDLAGIESRIEKLEARRDLLKSERELDALNSELEKLRGEKDVLETSIFSMMEQSDDLKLKLDSLKEELALSDVQTASDIDGLNKKIESLNSEVANTRNSFYEMKEMLTPAVRSKFEKLINSRDGIAIAKLNGETCTHCNFQVPPSLAASIKSTTVANCTNCGRFIY